MNEPPVCRRCGLEYNLREGEDPSILCDRCAQVSVVELLAVVKEALEESRCDGDLCAHRWHENARSIIENIEGSEE